MTTARFLSLALALAVLPGAGVRSARAQGGEVLRNTMEGRTVVIKVDMPAINLGVDVWPGRDPELDAPALAKRMKEYGVGITAGSSYTISKILVQSHGLEILLGWGGAPLERDQRLPDMGSRFRVHYPKGVPREVLTPQGLSEAMGAYIDFATPMRTGLDAGGTDPQLADEAALAALKSGLARSEVEALLGAPFETLRRQENGRAVSLYSYRTRQGTLVAVFDGNRLLRWSLEPR